MKALPKILFIAAGGGLGIAAGYVWARKDMYDIKAGNKTAEESIVKYKKNAMVFAFIGLVLLAAAYFVSKKNS